MVNMFTSPADLWVSSSSVTLASTVLDKTSLELYGGYISPQAYAVLVGSTWVVVTFICVPPFLNFADSREE